MKRFLIFLIAIISISSAKAQKYTVETVPNDRLTDARDYTTNPDGIISAQAEQTINDMLAEAESSATAEVAVVLLNSVGYMDIDDFATQLFKHWGIGKAEKDNGLLFILVQDKREMVFRTGSGMEGVFPDVILSRIIRNDITPSLKEGDFDAGVIAGISQICEIMKNPEVVQEIKQQIQKEEDEAMLLLLIMYLSIGFIILLTAVFSMPKRKTTKTDHVQYIKMREWKSKIIKTAIFFPMPMLIYLIYYFAKINHLRNKPIDCPECGSKMRKLSEGKEDAYLTEGQQKEEKLKSIDSDVWRCNSCQAIKILPYPSSKSSRYSVCPHCKAATYYVKKDKTLKRATSSRRGEGEKTYICKNCLAKDVVKYVIPMIIYSSSSSSGGSSWGGGSSSSGDSWGGGSTGGGGARGGW